MASHSQQNIHSCIRGITFITIYSFAIYDSSTGNLFCARDHMGFKPIFYLDSSDLFLFSTEIKGIKAHPDVTLTMNELFVADALLTLRSEKNKTFYNEIHRLPPAHYMIVTPDKTTIKKYWDLNPHYELKLSSEEAYIEAFRENLKEAVRCRPRSAWPVGGRA